MFAKVIVISVKIGTAHSFSVKLTEFSAVYRICSSFTNLQIIIRKLYVKLTNFFYYRVYRLKIST